MWWPCLAAFLCIAVLQCGGDEPHLLVPPLSGLPEVYDDLKQRSKHIDYYYMGKTEGDLEIPVLVLSKDARERSLVGVPKICFFPAVSPNEGFSRNLMLQIVWKLAKQENQLITSLITQFALHTVMTIGIQSDEIDFKGVFDMFPPTFLESEPPEFSRIAAEWLIKTRCLLTIAFGGYGRGVAIPFFSDPADIYAFNAAGHVIRDRRELEKESKKTVNPKLKDYDEDYTPPEYDGSIIQDIPIQNILESSFLTPADRNRTRRSSTSLGSDGDGPRVLNSETAEDKKTWAQRKSRDKDLTGSGNSATGTEHALNGNKNGSDAMTRRHGNGSQSLDNITSPDDGAYGKAKRSLEFPRGGVWGPGDREVGFQRGGGASEEGDGNRRSPRAPPGRGRPPKRDKEKDKRKDKEKKKEKEKKKGDEGSEGEVKVCLNDTRTHPLPPFYAPDHEDLVYLASKFSDALQSIHYPQCSLDDKTVCLPLNNTVFTGRTWRYVAGGLADFAYMKAGTLPMTIFAYCASDVTGFGLNPSVFDQVVDGLTSLILSTRYGVRGIVKNTKDEPLINVSYTVLGREQVVMTTNEHGEFSRLLLGKYTIQFRKDGYHVANKVFVMPDREILLSNVTMYRLDERSPDHNKDENEDEDQTRNGHSMPALAVAPLVAGLLLYIVIVLHDD
ncbi:uncharacterized protein LOC112562591 isoform X2 [Pomacea canaliculata]|uniref:uncharacterized protein LOC112562591 isoform X2 n=1 Tax=Pomacea canaliculata TaxID=400727 RepID=UPI000D72A38D|nr:uncharacterized protein LOC112562591 isoform X2 [Pomacea canaliculata]